jgi:GNAT superfamily N-acetyltransferase
VEERAFIDFFEEPAPKMDSVRCRFLVVAFFVLRILLGLRGGFSKTFLATDFTDKPFMSDVNIVRLDGLAQVGALARILVDCVEGGASVSFMPPLGVGEAEAFFRGVAEGVRLGERILLGAFVRDELVGTAQVVLKMPPNQPHRGDVAKLLVMRSARGMGVARALMLAVEREALAAGKTLLVLDTVTGGVAEGLYSRMGWVRVGEIPDYALMPDGELTATTIFYKRLTGWLC